jgi:hypothetical protein
VNSSFEDAIQKGSAPVKTSEITFIIAGQAQASCDGTPLLCLFDCLERNKHISSGTGESLAAFVDMPVLIPQENLPPFDHEDIMAEPGHHTEGILFFLDHLGVAHSALG